MSITTLPTPPRAHRYSAAWCDGSHRLYVYNLVFNNATSAYDLTVKGTLERYDPGTNSWTNMAQSSERVQAGEPGVRDSATAKWYRVGGQLIDNINNNFVPTVEIYDEGSNTWAFGPAIADPHLRGRQLVGGWIDSTGKLFAGGGYDNVDLADLYQLSGGAWVAKTSATASFGSNQARVLLDTTNRAYLFGSESATTPIQRYDPATNLWTTLANPAIAYLKPTPCIAASGLLYAVSTTGRALKYDPGANTWTTMAASPVTSALAGASSTIYDSASNAMYWLGISLPGFTFSSHIYKYDIATDTWSTLVETIAPRQLLPLGITPDGLGGYYLCQASSAGNLAVNVVEYFVPGAAALVAKQSWVAVIG